jgi:putative heme transporter
MTQSHIGRDDPAESAQVAAMSDVPTQSDISATGPRRRVRLSKVLAPLLSLAIVGGVFFYFLPQFTSISDVWTSIRSMTWLQTATLAVAALWNLATYWFVMVATMPGLRIREAAVVTESSTAVSNTLPAGGAIGIAMSYAMYDSWGFSRSRSSVSLLVAGVWNNFAKLAMPVLAVALLAFSGGGASTSRIVAGTLGIAGLIAAVTIFALLLRSDDMARRIGLAAGRIASLVIKPFRRPPVRGWDRATVKFRGRTLLLLRARWLPITLLTLVSHLSLFGVLLLSLRLVGVSQDQVSWVQALAVFAFARLLSAIPLTPGGLGVIEVALITGLAAAGGPRAEVAAAVLIFRALTYVLPIPVGLATYVFWRRNRSWRRPPNSAPRTSLVPETT